MDLEKVQHQDRLHALDAVRAFALMLGIVYHALFSFLPNRSGWAVADNSPSMTLAVIAFTSHIFRMSLFFVIAGFFAHLLYHRKGHAEFWRNRRERILYPFLVGWFVLSILLGILWGIGAQNSGLPIPRVPIPKADRPLIPIGLTHLWFLYYLFVIYGVALGARWIFITYIDSSGMVRGWIDRQFAALIKHGLAIFVFALPLAGCFILKATWMTGKGIPTPDRSPIPEWTALIGFGVAFTVGWLLHRQTNLLQHIVKRAYLFLGLAILLSFIALMGSGKISHDPIIALASNKIVGAFSYSMAIWCWTFAIIGIALQKFSISSPTTRYAADASYWLYIAHLPVVVALQIVVARWQWHWSAKLMFILCIAFPLLFASYHYLVRNTFLGEILNGRRYPPQGVLKAATAK